MKLLPTQYDFVNCGESSVLWVGGVGSGKTDGLGLWTLRESMLDGNVGVVAAKTNGQLEMSTIPNILEVYDKVGVDYDYKDWKKIMRFPNGSWFKFQTLDLDDGKLKGSNIGWFAVDEGDVCDESPVEKLEQRRRRPGTNMRMAICANSPHPKHWIEKWIAEKKFDRVFQSTTYENHFLSDDYIRRLEKIYPIGTSLWKRYMMGEIGVPLDGSILPEFNTEDHVIDESGLPSEENMIGYIAGLDEGWSDETCFLQAAIDKNDVLYIVGEHYNNRMLIDDHVNKIKEIWKGGQIFSDWDGQLRAEYLSRGLRCVPANKDFINGIHAVRERLWTKKIKIVGNLCPNLIAEFPFYVWGSNDRPAKCKDHAIDTLRYIVAALDLE
jgi:PBSX family phage terminase large subunit